MAAARQERKTADRMEIRVESNGFGPDRQRKREPMRRRETFARRSLQKDNGINPRAPNGNYVHKYIYIHLCVCVYGRSSLDNHEKQRRTAEIIITINPTVASAIDTTVINNNTRVYWWWFINARLRPTTVRVLLRLLIVRCAIDTLAVVCTSETGGWGHVILLG